MEVAAVVALVEGLHDQLVEDASLDLSLPHLELL